MLNIAFAGKTNQEIPKLPRAEIKLNHTRSRTSVSRTNVLAATTNRHLHPLI